MRGEKHTFITIHILQLSKKKIHKLTPVLLFYNKVTYTFMIYCIAAKVLLQVLFHFILMTPGRVDIMMPTLNR